MSVEVSDKPQLVAEWHSGFPSLSLAYEQFCPGVLGALAGHQEFPHVNAWGAVSPRGEPGLAGVQFVVQDDAAIRRAGGYDFYIRDTAFVPCRVANWHDLFNALVWLHYPELKREIHRLQLADFAARTNPGRRTQLGDAATLLDECGCIVLSSDESLFEDIRELRWRRVFFERRAELLAHARFLVVGHALLHALLRPHVGLMGHALLVSAPQAELRSWGRARRFADSWAGAELRLRLTGTRDMCPLPLLGIPGYVPNDSAAFYDDLPDYFRARRARAQVQPTGGEGP